MEEEKFDDVTQVVISSQDGVNAVLDNQTQKFISNFSRYFYTHKEEYGYTESDFDGPPSSAEIKP